MGVVITGPQNLLARPRAPRSPHQGHQPPLGCQALSRPAKTKLLSPRTPSGAPQPPVHWDPRTPPRPRCPRVQGSQGAGPLRSWGSLLGSEGAGGCRGVGAGGTAWAAEAVPCGEGLRGVCPGLGGAGGRVGGRSVQGQGAEGGLVPCRTRREGRQAPPWPGG